MFTAIKKEILPSVTRMDSDGIMLSEVSQRQILYGFTHMWNLKQKRKSNKQNKTKTNSQIEQNSGYQWERWFRGKTGEGGQLYGVCVCVRARILSHIQLFEIPRAVACQAPLNFSGKNTGASCYFPLQGIFLTQGWNPHLTHLQHWQADSLPLHHLGSPQ